MENKRIVKKELILNFIKKHTIGVLATATPDGLPEAAVIEFAETDNFELIFDTFTTYRKYKNLKNNSRVAFVIGWDENVTVQYEGVAEELAGDELKRYKKIYFKKNPDAQKWERFKETTWFRITPKWIRYRDGNASPMAIHEISF